MFPSRLLAAAVVAAIVIGPPTLALAAFEEPTGWTKPVDNTQAAAELTTYQEWTPTSALSTSYHDVPPGANTPDLSANPNGTPDVYDADAATSGSGIASSSGNIYSQTGVLNPEALIPSYNLGGLYDTRFLVQLWTSGSDLTPTLTVNGVDADTLGGFDYEQLTHVTGSFTPPGAPFPVTFHTIEHRFVFTVAGSAASYTLNFDWQGQTSTSLGHFRVDTQTVATPTPAAAAMGGLGLAVLAMRRRQRKKGA